MGLRRKPPRCVVAVCMYYYLFKALYGLRSGDLSANLILRKTINPVNLTSTLQYITSLYLRGRLRENAALRCVESKRGKDHPQPLASPDFCDVLQAFPKTLYESAMSALGSIHTKT
jgi:hypothetical protein